MRFIAEYLFFLEIFVAHRVVFSTIPSRNHWRGLYFFIFNKHLFSLLYYIHNPGGFSSIWLGFRISSWKVIIYSFFFFPIYKNSLFSILQENSDYNGVLMERVVPNWKNIHFFMLLWHCGLEWVNVKQMS